MKPDTQNGGLHERAMRRIENAFQRQIGEIVETHKQVVPSDTPLTDVEEYSAIANTNSALLANDKQYVVLSDFARSLERERDRLKSQVEELRGALENAIPLLEEHATGRAPLMSEQRKVLLSIEQARAAIAKVSQ